MIRLKGSMKRALEISAWLKDRGYIHDRDYTWHMAAPLGARRSLRDSDIIFICKKPKLETFIALQWLDQE